MNLEPLSQSVEQFARALAGTPDAALDRPWAWQSYDSEGARFAFFRTYEELRGLAASLRQQRSQSEVPISEAQRILGTYHAALRDLQAALLGVAAGALDQAPAENEWPVRQVIAHILGSDLGFYAVTAFALETLREGLTEPQHPTDEAWERLTGLDEAAYAALMQRPAAELLAQLDDDHRRAIDLFATLGAVELDGLSYYWEDEPYPLRFRLQRFDSHLRQHTIQVDKTLAALGLPPTETQRLLRLIYAALADAESAWLGSPDPLPGEVASLAQAIDARRGELEGIVG